MKEFHEPLFWASFSVYGQDSLINVEEIRRSNAEESFSEAQKIAIERFRLVAQSKGKTNVFRRHEISLYEGARVVLWIIFCLTCFIGLYSCTFFLPTLVQRIGKIICVRVLGNFFNKFKYFNAVA